MVLPSSINVHTVVGNTTTSQKLISVSKLVGFKPLVSGSPYNPIVIYLTKGIILTRETYGYVS